MITQVGGGYALVEATGIGLVDNLAAEFLPLPHLTLTLWPSMSMPFAQASAARSAESRSLKLTNAHLTCYQFPGDLTLSVLACKYSLRLSDVYD